MALKAIAHMKKGLWSVNGPGSEIRDDSLFAAWIVFVECTCSAVVILVSRIRRIQSISSWVEGGARLESGWCRYIVLLFLIVSQGLVPGS